jgi:hypothetical protein
MSDPVDLSRFLQHYAKHYNAGAFATPTAKELAATPADMIDEVVTPTGRSAVIGKRLTRNSTRRDFTGRRYDLPAGALVAGTVARTGDAPLPDLDRWDFVIAYADDRALTSRLRAERDLTALNISAAGEMKACWGRPGTSLRYDPVDVVTVGRVAAAPTLDLAEAMRAEVQNLSGWDDDYPFYSDGSWSAVSLRGFYPDDPSRGVKPAEMPDKWKADNPADLERACDWTRLAERCPTIVGYVESIGWWRRLERVRLLRMAGRGGKGGALKRHSDITDRAAGTRDGQIARFHVAIQTHPDIKMTAWQFNGTPVDVHLAPGETWYLDQRKPHAVRNPTGIDRIHLVVDVLCDDDARRQIAAAR